ncbi:hypothetical protein N7532_005741 [Penicillium argentinense]|uniref:Gfo/Idh/MocA-like oxidoreductase N-terminal domain-containing protein n=1 Tax=Penicillium argentinense TaxID=1131581 RepID=A0A9W9FEQ9_9EURO|nr:uncharacterized protein N7532_005741 [Penicillium argentinense]KAJ5098740.1 hypothetical protein N7532_005741 [Penicillium argentinense]
MSQLPSVHWGILTTGKIASWYVADLMLSRRDAKVRHIVRTIGTSDVNRGKPASTQSRQVNTSSAKSPLFTLNARKAREVFNAAREKGVFIVEAMWLRHRPLTRELQRLVHEEKVIGEIFRATSDFGSELDIPSLPLDKYYRQNAMGAGSLLDMGVYSLLKSKMPKILAAQTDWEDVETNTSAILQFPSTGKQGIMTSTAKVTTN